MSIELDSVREQCDKASSRPAPAPAAKVRNENGAGDGSKDSAGGRLQDDGDTEDDDDPEDDGDAEDDDDMKDDGLDGGLREMLEHLHRMQARDAGSRPPMADIQELDDNEGINDTHDANHGTDTEAPGREAGGAEPSSAGAGHDGPMTHESLSCKTKADIERLMRDTGVPFKRSDPKNKLVDALLEFAAQRQA